MALKMIVLIKQVPDTHNITGDAMKPDGTVNRLALPAIINPEDLNALEEALKIKETVGGSITVITMGPSKAVESLKECLFRGADDAILVSDRRFAAADTLATSYALSCGIQTVDDYDLILCGRQAIDGDTAQVGPQTAEKLGINQFTSVSEIIGVDQNSITARRIIDSGYEIVSSKLPILLTIVSEANEPRSPSAKRVMALKNLTNQRDLDVDYLDPQRYELNGYIKEWNVEDINAEPQQCGLAGSPTKVKKIQNVVLTVGDAKIVQNTETSINILVRELITDHIIG
jgi:electron transfer flavoprotein beta subunit